MLFMLYSSSFTTPMIKFYKKAGGCGHCPLDIVQCYKSTMLQNTKYTMLQNTKYTMLQKGRGTRPLSNARSLLMPRGLARGRLRGMCYQKRMQVSSSFVVVDQKNNKTSSQNNDLKHPRKDAGELVV